MQINLIDMSGNSHPYTMQDNKLDLYTIYNIIRGEIPDSQMFDDQNFCKLRFAATLTPSDAQSTYTDEAQVYLHYCDISKDTHIQLSASTPSEYNENIDTAIAGSDTDNVYFVEAIR